MKMPSVADTLQSAAVDGAKTAMEPVYRKLTGTKLWEQLQELPTLQRGIAVVSILWISAMLKENLPRSSRFWRFLAEVIEDIPSELLDGLGTRPNDHLARYLATPSLPADIRAEAQALYKKAMARANQTQPKESRS
jgi:hypothetical protein